MLFQVILFLLFLFLQFRSSPVNLYPLTIYLLLGQVAGEGIQDIKSALKGDFTFRKDRTLLKRAIENSFTPGGFGKVGDVFNTMYNVASGSFWASAADAFTSPTAKDAVSFSNGVAKALGGNPKELIKFAGRKGAPTLLYLNPVRKIPGSGIILRVMGDLLANTVTK